VSTKLLSKRRLVLVLQTAASMCTENKGQIAHKLGWKPKVVGNILRQKHCALDIEEAELAAMEAKAAKKRADQAAKDAAKRAALDLEQHELVSELSELQSRRSTACSASRLTATC